MKSHPDMPKDDKFEAGDIKFSPIEKNEIKKEEIKEGIKKEASEEIVEVRREAIDNAEKRKKLIEEENLL